MPLPPDITERIARAKANGFTDEQIAADMRRKYGVGPEALGSARKPQSLLGSSPKLEALAGFTGGKQVANLGGALAFLASKDKKAADTSQSQLDALTQKYVREALSKYGPGDPRREKALKHAGAGYADTSSFQGDVANTGPNGRELAADIGKLGLTAVGLKTPANFAGKLGLTRSVGVSTGLGAGFGGLNAIEEGKSPAQVAASAAASGLTAGALRGVFGLGGRAFNKATSTVPERVYKLSTAMRRGDRADELLKRGLVGNRSQLATKANALLSQTKDDILSAPSARETVSAAKLRSNKAVQDFLRESTSEGRYDQALKLLRRLIPKGETSRGNLFQRRIDLDRVTSPQAHMFGGAQALESRGKAAVANAMRDFVNAAPEASAAMPARQQAGALLDAIQADQHGREKLGGFFLEILRRAGLTPAVGTRIARAGYASGEPFRKLSQNAIMEAVRRAIATGTAQGLGRLTGEQ